MVPTTVPVLPDCAPGFPKPLPREKESPRPTSNSASGGDSHASRHVGLLVSNRSDLGVWPEVVGMSRPSRHGPRCPPCGCGRVEPFKPCDAIEPPAQLGADVDALRARGEDHELSFHALPPCLGFEEEPAPHVPPLIEGTGARGTSATTERRSNRPALDGTRSGQRGGRTGSGHALEFTPTKGATRAELDTATLPTAADPSPGLVSEPLLDFAKCLPLRRLADLGGRNRGQQPGPGGLAHLLGDGRAPSRSPPQAYGGGVRNSWRSARRRRVSPSSARPPALSQRSSSSAARCQWWARSSRPIPVSGPSAPGPTL
jgi:hypothetical protein